MRSVICHSLIKKAWPNDLPGRGGAQSPIFWRSSRSPPDRVAQVSRLSGSRRSGDKEKSIWELAHLGREMGTLESHGKTRSGKPFTYAEWVVKFLNILNVVLDSNRGLLCKCL
ncbi:hypothetical protein AVEN_110284-1 [Araneus ventricosus]|uniref:Uncharacterized protein n=1 Tax=Araneus ventricosus TaxID=182803 RepID=A0A4Y2DPA0_ARAVE|nr:hypothetical protein AVEN_110284-1 [Araneus ventricosus]